MAGPLCEPAMVPLNCEKLLCLIPLLIRRIGQRYPWPLRLLLPEKTRPVCVIALSAF